MLDRRKFGASYVLGLGPTVNVKRPVRRDARDQVREFLRAADEGGGGEGAGGIAEVDEEEGARAD